MTREKKRRASFEDISSDTAKQAYKKNKKRQKRLGTLIVLCFLFSLLFLLGCGLMGTSAWMHGGVTTTGIPQDNESLGIAADTKEHDAVNIALFGVETARPGETLVGSLARAAVLSVNTDSNTAKIVSVSPSVWVEIGEACPTEDGSDVFAMSYAYGGPVCAVRVLNSTFGLDIRDYVAVDVNAFEQILTAFGVEQLEENGSMSAAVLSSIAQMPAEEYPEVLKQVLELTETSLSVSDVLGLSAVLFDPFVVEYLEVPGTFVPGEEETKNDMPVILINKNQASTTVHDFLYTYAAKSSRSAEGDAEQASATE